MRKLLIITGLCIVMIALIVTPVLATSPQDSSQASPQGMLNSGDVPDGSMQVINITYKVLNTVDSGVDNPIWAVEDINRSIQVWEISEGTYYAIVKDSGTWQTFAEEQSPGSEDYLQANDGKGTLHGGYIMVITADGLVTEPEYKTHGNIGSFDYEGTEDMVTNDDSKGLFPFDWINAYFVNANSSYEFWGWTYKHKNQTWNNISTGNSGDIQIP